MVILLQVLMVTGYTVTGTDGYTVTGTDGYWLYCYRY